jgi:thioredoxin 1
MEQAMKPVEITEQDFAGKVEQGKGLSVVDFTAEWCRPCKALAPVVEELASEYAGKVSFFKLDVDKNQPVAQRYMVRSVPTLIFFKDGKVVDSLIGALPKQKLVEVITRHL